VADGGAVAGEGAGDAAERQGEAYVGQVHGGLAGAVGHGGALAGADRLRGRGERHGDEVGDELGAGLVLVGLAIQLQLTLAQARHAAAPRDAKTPGG
jgi:hypothetical protein